MELGSLFFLSICRFFINLPVNQNIKANIASLEICHFDISHRYQEGDSVQLPVSLPSLRQIEIQILLQSELYVVVVGTGFINDQGIVLTKD